MKETERIRSAYSKRQKADPRYSLFDPSNLFRMAEVERHILMLLAQSGFNQLNLKRILDVGCGGGYWIREFIKWGALPENIIGIDLLPERIASARKTCPSGVTLLAGDAANLEFVDDSFDIVIQSTVFTSILDAGMKHRIAAEMTRVVKPDGCILWYDYHLNNPNNPDVRGVKKKEIYDLFPGCRIKLRRITLAPPISRLLAPYSYLLCYLLSKLPFLCTHYLGMIKRSPDSI